MSEKKQLAAAEMPPPYPRSTSAVSLHERFSQLQHKQLTFDPIPLQPRRLTPLVLAVKEEPSSLLHPQRLKQRLGRKRRSVWTHLGGQQTASLLPIARPRGFWSFMKKYGWRARCSSNCRGRGPLSRQLAQRQRAQRRLLRTTDVQKATAGRRQRGGATSLRGRGFSRDDVLTKRQLDAQLDQYMSLSKSRLDKELDDYMSMSRRRLDAQLDEYMSLAGQSQLHWDGDADDEDIDGGDT